MHQPSPGHDGARIASAAGMISRRSLRRGDQTTVDIEPRRRLGLSRMTTDRPMTAEQVATLKRLAEAAYELEAFQPNLTRAEADLRIAMLTAKLKLLDGPPHTLRVKVGTGATHGD
jgi:hypothetical protein